MKAYDVTITSKNQITIPIEVVRGLNLTKKKILGLTVKGKKILLTPEVDIEEVMRPFWGKHHAKPGLSDDELRNAIRESVATHADA
jgi:bifunctional DNA-binding transcriptional regulator/antitoxin component of YhaV-PrlF toxin-antitoxin module